jgi:MAE_28990/MAE_18760-like HEPN
MTVHIRSTFAERTSEVNSYLEFLTALEQETTKGPPTIGAHVVTTDQQRMLYSSLYLQLYNLVETTVMSCIGAVASEISNTSSRLPDHLSESLKREWVGQMARTHEELNVENRLKFALELCDFLVQQLPITDMQISRGGGGNWDDEEISKLLKRLGFDPRMTSSAVTEAKRHIKNEMGALKLVRTLRNQLAHGSISFVQCGEGVVVADLKDITQRVFHYLDGLIQTFSEHIVEQSFLADHHRESTAA